MQVNAISNSLGFTGQFQRKNKDIEDVKIIKDDSSVNPYKNNVSNRSMTNAAKAAIVGMLLIPIGGAVTSCDSESYAEAWAKAEATAKDSCGCNYLNGRDTITVHDTITQIIENRDTIYVKKGYDSPVIDVIRDFFESTDIPLGDERIPLKITWVDEHNVPLLNKMLFDGRSSSYDEVNYIGENTPWNDETGSFVIGSGTTYENIRYSLTGDGKLLMMRYVPRTEGKKPESRGDWMYSNSAVYDINTGEKIVDRYREDITGGREWAGTFTPGDMPNTILVTNPFDTNWRYSNVKVETGEAPEID